MQYFRIVEWSEYQHYKDRDPPWIKLHRDLLTSRTWVNLDDSGRVLAVACMLIAAGTENKIPADPTYIRRRAYLDYDPDFHALEAVGFIELVSDSNELRPDGKRPLADASKPYSEGEERQRRGEKSREDSARTRKTALPSDWKPSDGEIAYAREQGCIDPSDTAERFKLHHVGKGTKHADWRAAFQYWCRNEKNFRRPSGAAENDPWAGVDI